VVEERLLRFPWSTWLLPVEVAVRETSAVEVVLGVIVQALLVNRQVEV